jgi:hypothetical protein
MVDFQEFQEKEVQAEFLAPQARVGLKDLLEIRACQFRVLKGWMVPQEEMVITD